MKTYPDKAVALGPKKSAYAGAVVKGQKANTKKAPKKAK